MLRATAVLRRASVKPEDIDDNVTLNHGERHCRRVVLTSDLGLSFLLDLEKACVLDDGDALPLDDGRLVRVKAAPEQLLEIRAENPTRLLRVAWHIGNRHTPAEITPDAVYIEQDHVLAEMVRAQGCSLRAVTRPFRPERGAYDHGGHSHGHGHAASGHARS